MPSADFCTTFGTPYGLLSLLPDIVQTSQGKTHNLLHTVAGFTGLPLDGYGLCGLQPTRPDSPA